MVIREGIGGVKNGPLPDGRNRCIFIDDIICFGGTLGFAVSYALSLGYSPQDMFVYSIDAREIKPGQTISLEFKLKHIIDILFQA